MSDSRRMCHTANVGRTATKNNSDLNLTWFILNYWRCIGLGRSVEVCVIVIKVKSIIQGDESLAPTFTRREPGNITAEETARDNN